MINGTTQYNVGTVVEYLYDMGELVAIVADRTQAVATTMIDKDGDHYEQLSATEDNKWELHRYANDAWEEVCAMTRAYHHCAPTQCDRDSVTQQYSIILEFPATWQERSVLPLDYGMRDYMVSAMTARWWQAKGMTAQMEMEITKKASAEKEIRYSMNSRTHRQRSTSWI